MILSGGCIKGKGEKYIWRRVSGGKPAAVLFCEKIIFSKCLIFRYLLQQAESA